MIILPEDFQIIAFLDKINFFDIQLSNVVFKEM